MGNKHPLTNTAMKGHRMTVTIEDPIYKKMQSNVGKSKRFATESHAINYSLAKELGVQIEE